jgi:hypothetical protein
MRIDVPSSIMRMQYVDAAASGQVDVEQHHVDNWCAQQLAQLAVVAGLADHFDVAGLGQGFAQAAAHQRNGRRRR